MIFIEIRVKEAKAKYIKEKLKFQERYLDNYNKHTNGRLWISWNSTKYDINLVLRIDQAIHCRVYDNYSNHKFYLPVIYAHNQLEKRKIVWNTIESIQSIVQGPCCIIVVFNNVLSARDKIGGRLVTEDEYKDLQEILQHTGLTEVDSIGDHFTWSNKHSVGTIYSIIDRMLGNIDWFRDNMDKCLKCLPPSVSDHSMTFFKDKTCRIKKAKRFKFYNCITEMEGFTKFKD